jgi:predicted transposase YdaD
VIKCIDFIDIYAHLNEDERIVYSSRYPEEDKFMSTFAERFRQEGKQEGMQQGMQQGMRQGEAQILLRQLSLKFGEIPADKKRLVESADTESLKRWSERILSATSMDEVLQ